MQQSEQKVSTLRFARFVEASAVYNFANSKSIKWKVVKRLSFQCEAINLTRSTAMRNTDEISLFLENSVKKTHSLNRTVILKLLQLDTVRKLFFHVVLLNIVNFCTGFLLGQYM